MVVIKYFICIKYYAFAGSLERSGHSGQKPLTATALLFALYQPAPFCIGDANIEKPNRIIRQFSKESQFIVVTHNKATMTAVDTIYGVDMPEQGVSEVTPVDFSKLSIETMVFEAS